MTITALPNPHSNPAGAFQTALETIRNRISARGEVPQVRNLISDDAISELNLAAAAQYDPMVCTVQFYGGMIHRYPTATFTIEDGESGKLRTTSRELADMLIVTVFTSPASDGVATLKRTRACLVQAKLSDAVNGPKVLNLNTQTQDTPEATDPEQFYLLNRWPPFKLESETPNITYNLLPLDTKDKPMAKYCFLWKNATPHPVLWPSSWQCGDPLPGNAANHPLGKVLADFIDSVSYIGRDFTSAAVDDWDKLINQLTSHCRVNTWGTESKLADPAKVSFADRIAAYGTLMQHIPIFRPSMPNSPFGPRYLSGSAGAGWPAAQGRSNADGMPVLVISVSSFAYGDEFKEMTKEVRGKIIKDALGTLGGDRQG